jgi:hypothetical protein
VWLYAKWDAEAGGCSYVVGDPCGVRRQVGVARVFLRGGIRPPLRILCPLEHFKKKIFHENKQVHLYSNKAKYAWRLGFLFQISTTLKYLHAYTQIHVCPPFADGYLYFAAPPPLAIFLKKTWY